MSRLWGNLCGTLVLILWYCVVTANTCLDVVGVQCGVWEGYRPSRTRRGSQGSCHQPDRLHHLLCVHVYRQRSVWEGQDHIHGTDDLRCKCYLNHHNKSFTNLIRSLEFYVAMLTSVCQLSCSHIEHSGSIVLLASVLPYCCPSAHWDFLSQP